MFEYMHQDSRCTLREGIAEYYRENPGLKRDADLRPEARDFFRCHDAIHVLYGCDTSLSHEAIVKLSSFFGTTEGFGVIAGYRLYDSKDIYRQLRLGDILLTMAESVVIVPRTLARCGRQRAKWPWSNFDQHLDTPLCDLRAEFGVRVAVRPGAEPRQRPAAC